MPNYKDKIIAFYDGQGLSLAFVDDIIKEKAQLINKTSRKFNIPLRNIIYTLTDYNVSYNDSSEFLKNLEEEASNLSSQIETDILWEMLDPADYSLEELCDLYYGEYTGKDFVALYLAVNADEIHFKIKKMKITRRSLEQVNDQRKLFAKKKEKELYLIEVNNWIDQVLSTKDEELAAPKNLDSFINQIESYLFNKSNNDAAKILSARGKELNPGNTAVKILKLTNRISANADPFLLKAGIKEEFSEKIINDSELLEDFKAEDRRTTSSATHAFSIDDEETKDIDDVISITHEDDHTIVTVYIAEPSYFVKENSTLDQEARKRGTSIYLPDRTVPMFPPKLSKDKASLIANRERPALAYQAKFDNQNNITETSIFQANLNVSHRLSYTETNNILDDKSHLLNEEISDLESVAKALRQTRLNNGAVELIRPDIKIRVINNQVQIKPLHIDARSQLIVSEMMILANYIAAKYCFDNELPCIYRSQNAPDELPVQEDSYNPVLFEQTIKCLKKTKTTVHPSSHSGLGLDFYTQVTSPIRRYSDLIMEKQLIHHVNKKETLYSENDIMKAFAATTPAIQEAREVQNQADNFWLLTWLEEQRLNIPLEATIVSKLSSGYLAEINEIFYKTKIHYAEKLEIGDQCLIEIIKVNANKNFMDIKVHGKNQSQY